METFITLSTGLRMEYVEQGAPDGVPVLFLHGVTDSWRSFEQILPLLPRDIRAFSLSQRGHGESSRPAAGYGFGDMAADVIAFMDAMGLATAVIVGHSMGASVAQRLLADHSRRVAAAVLLGAFATYEDPGFQEFVASSILPLADPIDPAFAREWQLSTLAQDTDATHLDAVVRDTLKVPAFVWHATFQAFLAAPDATADLGAIAVPVLLLWGDRDSYTSRAQQDRLRRALPHAQLRVYEGFGHALHWEDPARTVAELRTFVADVWRVA